VLIGHSETLLALFQNVPQSVYKKSCKHLYTSTSSDPCQGTSFFCSSSKKRIVLSSTNSSHVFEIDDIKDISGQLSSLLDSRYIISIISH
jgi:hypothetical protein